jgi:hypothetical protein
MKKTVWTFGLISGVILSLFMAIGVAFQSRIGMDKAEYLGYTTMVVAFLLIFFGVRSYRDTVGGGTIGFGRAMAVGTLIALISSVCYVATWEVIYYKFMPDFATKYAAHMVDKVRASGASQAEIDAKVAETQKFVAMYANPFYNAALTLIEPLPVGLVIALISAGVLRRTRREEPGGALAQVSG